MGASQVTRALVEPGKPAVTREPEGSNFICINPMLSMLPLLLQSMGKQGKHGEHVETMVSP